LNKTIPAVSIIIPMYNVEKYVGECLDSILNQTFQDFEVIAVDDCSTDKTCEVVESYLPRFEGKLQLIRSKKNSGGQVGIPRNKGMRYSIGKYLYFMDSDDVILENALEILYNTAEKLDADVIHCNERYPVVTEKFTEYKNQLNAESKNTSELRTTTIELEERINLLLSGKLTWEPWTNLIKRDLLMENNLEFPNLSIADDMAFMAALICISKKFVITQKPFYVWRQRGDSNSRKNSSPEIVIHKRGGDVFRGLKFFEEFSNKLDFFKKNPDYKYKIFDFLTRKEILIALYAQVPAHLLDGLVRRELSEFDDTTAITAFLFARMNLLNVQLIQAQNLLRQQPKEVQDFRRQNEIIQRQQAQINELQQQLRNVHDIFR